MYKIMTPGPTQVRENVRLARSLECTNPDLDPAFYDYYKEKNLALPIILGINNSQEMNEKIMSGEIYGSVDNNMDNQVLRIVKCMESVLNGNTKKYN